MNLFGTIMLWWFFVAIGMGLFGTSYMALNMFSAGNIGGGFLFGIGFYFGWFKTYQICNDVLADSLTRTILSILLIIVTVFVFFGLVYIIHHSALAHGRIVTFQGRPQHVASLPGFVTCRSWVPGLRARGALHPGYDPGEITPPSRSPAI